MRIALVNHRVGTNSGQGRVNYIIAREAVRRGHDVVLLASRVDDGMREASSVDHVKIEVDAYPTALLRNQVFAWKSYRWLQDHQSAVDCVVANGSITWASPSVNIVHYLHRSRLSSSFASVGARSGLKKYYQLLYTLLNAIWERIALYQASTIVAVSRQVRDSLREAGITGPDVHVIPNGVDPETFYPSAGPVPEARSAFGLPAGVSLALFVGDIRRPLKNLETVLRAVRRVPTCHLAVAGPMEGSPYPDMVRNWGLTDRIHFLGTIDDVPALMRASDVFVFPSRYESFSLVVLEAMASGLPVLTTSAVGASRLLTPDCGVVIDDPEDVPAIVRFLQRMLDDADRRRQMGMKARDIVLDYTVEDMAHRHLSVIEEAGRS